jgi:hypothetical protein
MWKRTYAPYLPFRRIFETEEQVEEFKRTVRSEAHASSIDGLEAECKGLELYNYAANYILIRSKPLKLLQELAKDIGASPRKLIQLKQSTLKLADAYEQLFKATLVPSDVPILIGFKQFAPPSLLALPQLLRTAATRVEHWPDREYRRWLSDRNLKSYYLAALCVHVSTFTGRPHYEEIATLLTEVADWLRLPAGFDALGVRKDFAAFKQRNSEMMWMIEMLADIHRAEHNPTAPLDSSECAKQKQKMSRKQKKPLHHS